MTTTPSQPAPPPTGTVPYLPQDYPGARPTSVTVIAGIGMVLGALMLLYKPATLALLIIKLPGDNPILEVMRNDSFIRGWMVVSVATGWLVSMLLLLSSIGSLRLRDWGRWGMLAYAALALVMTALSQVVGVLAIQPALAPALREIASKNPSSFQMSPGSGMVVSIVLQLWFPLLILIFFTRPHVKRAFAEGEVASPL
jgi:hypothetical protein